MSGSNGLTQVFADDFNGTTLDRSKWPVLYGGGALYSNGAYRWESSQVSVGNGLLDIGMTRGTDGIWDVGGLSTALYPGADASLGVGILHGRVEIRAKVSAAITGAGPCFLLWPTSNDHWPPEVNILETPQGKGMFTDHWAGPNNANWYTSYLFALDYTQWHTYALDWTASQMTLSVDGVAVHSFTSNIPTEKMSVGLQGYVASATDGWYGGVPSPTGPGHVDILVDSVKVYAEAPAPLPVPTPTPRTDFSANGQADLLWQHEGGQAALWLMNGADPTGGALVGDNPGASWHLRAAADLNADGKPDLIWQSTSGQAALWQMNGTAPSGSALLGENPGTSWQLRAAADLDGDGKPDLLWQNTNGQAAVWLMNGTTPSGGALLGDNPGPTWHLRDAADLNADGHVDLLWQSDSGQAAAWLMNGTQVLSGVLIVSNPGPTWHLRGSADLNGDGKPDLLWQNDSGQAAAWFMNGTTPTGSTLLGGNPGAAWHLL